MANIDRETFQMLFDMSGKELLSTLVDTFRDATPRLLVDLKAALQSGDAIVFRRSAHSIKSNAATFGAMELAAIAKQVELLGKEQRLSESAALVAELDRLIPLVCTELQEMCR